jgi:hypothetical protein
MYGGVFPTDPFFTVDAAGRPTKTSAEVLDRYFDVPKSGNISVDTVMTLKPAQRAYFIANQKEIVEYMLAIQAVGTLTGGGRYSMYGGAGIIPSPQAGASAAAAHVEAGGSASVPHGNTGDSDTSGTAGTSGDSGTSGNSGTSGTTGAVCSLLAKVIADNAKFIFQNTDFNFKSKAEKEQCLASIKAYLLTSATIDAILDRIDAKANTVKGIVDSSPEDDARDYFLNKLSLWNRT